VNYMHLVDHARVRIEETYRRPFLDRALRQVLALVLPYPKRFRLALAGAWLARPLRGLLPRGRLRAMLDLTPAHLASPSATERPGIHPAQGVRGRVRRGRVALLAGCAQQVLDPAINEATIRLLTRLGIEVVVAKGAGCCGALTHHMGREEAAQASARANIEAWDREISAGGLDAIIINTSGCGTVVKEYAFIHRNAEPALRDAAMRVSALALDISEYLVKIGYVPTREKPTLRVAYHAACSLQHGQRVTEAPKALLRAAGFTVKEPAESHLCCGSAGTYNILQPDIAPRLRARKLERIADTGADVIAAGNIGCLTQLAGGALPTVHTVQLLDWMAGGPVPGPIAGLVA